VWFSFLRDVNHSLIDHKNLSQGQISCKNKAFVRRKSV
jgi:hypothetical protein